MKPLQEKFLAILEKTMPTNDPSHDKEHIYRVLEMATLIGNQEGADLEILIPAAIFHDAVIYQKNDPRNKQAPDESALFAQQTLQDEASFPQEKILAVMTCIQECSWSRGLPPSSKESAVLQDADRLEATGAISLMRTFCSGGQMNRPLYNIEDPFCESSIPHGVACSLDLLYQRLLLVADRINTAAAKEIALRRHQFLKQFESELKQELSETGRYKKPTS